MNIKIRITTADHNRHNEDTPNRALCLSIQTKEYNMLMLASYNTEFWYISLNISNLFFQLIYIKTISQFQTHSRHYSIYKNYPICYDQKSILLLGKYRLCGQTIGFSRTVFIFRISFEYNTMIFNIAKQKVASIKHIWTKKTAAVVYALFL